jgi:hypothetical protein
LPPYTRDFLVGPADRLRKPVDLFDDNTFLVRLRARSLAIERTHIIARIVLRHKLDRLGEGTIVVLVCDLPLAISLHRVFSSFIASFSLPMIARPPKLRPIFNILTRPARTLPKLHSTDMAA